MVFGLKGWYWKMPSGRLGVIYGEDEKLAYIDSLYERDLARFLQVDLGLQDELRAYHDSKASPVPKSPPLTPRRYRGKIHQILAAGTSVPT